MKKLTILLLLLLSVFLVFFEKEPDTVTLVHKNYTSIYSKTLHYPILVEWWETRKKDECDNQLPRKDQFAPDPLLKTETTLQKYYDEANKIHRSKELKGFDRGHMCPAASNECSGDSILTECFYFSNMAPQYHSLNAGDWKTLETNTRDSAFQNDSIHVWAGSYGEEEKYGILSIPEMCWKVIYVAKTKKYYAYNFKNTPDKPSGLKSHEVNVIDIEKITGFNFISK